MKRRAFLGYVQGPEGGRCEDEDRVGWAVFSAGRASGWEMAPVSFIHGV